MRHAALLVAFAIAFLVPAILTSTGSARSATEEPSPGPYVTPGPEGAAPGVLRWEPIGPPWLRHARTLRFPVAWSGGFAVLEEQPSDDTARARAIWRSPDGHSWSRARLPDAIRDARGLLPFRDGLVLIAAGERPARGYGFSLAFWRSSDGSRWRRAGDLSYRVPDSLERRNCQANDQQVATTDDRIIVYVEVCWDPCCGTQPIGSGIAGQAALAARVTDRLEPRGVAAWSSPDGRRWERVQMEGMAPPGTDDYGLVIRQQPDELLALREGRDPAILRSTDGVAWSTYGTAPATVDWYGSLELAAVPDGIVLIAESTESAPGYGNEMVMWHITPSTTVETLRLRPAFANWVVADGPHVLIGGRSWGPGPSGYLDDDQDWAWLLGSADGGATWPSDRSWTGGPDSCTRDAAVQGATVVALTCVGDRSRNDDIPAHTPALWTGSMDVFPSETVEPTAAPSPTGHQAIDVPPGVPAP